MENVTIKKMSEIPDLDAAEAFARKCKRSLADKDSSLDNLARAYLALRKEQKEIDECLEKAHTWLERAMP